MRTSTDLRDNDGNLLQGFDYDLQVWVIPLNGKAIVQDCGHNPALVKCCNARIYKGLTLHLARKLENLNTMSIIKQIGE